MAGAKCNEHSGCVANIERNAEDIQRLWKEISRIRGILIAILASSVTTMLGIVILTVLKVKGVG